MVQGNILMAVTWVKYIVKKTIKSCSGCQTVCGLPLIKGKIWILASEHPIVHRLVKQKVLLKLNDQTKVANNEPK